MVLVHTLKSSWLLQAIEELMAHNLTWLDFLYGRSATKKLIDLADMNQTE